MARALTLALLLGCLRAFAPSAAASAAAPTWDQLKAYYDYDRTAPLQAQVQPLAGSGPFIGETIHFRSANEQLVPATLCRPQNVAKPPVIICLHGLGGDGKSFATVLGSFLCPAGVAVIAIDAQYHGERKVAGKAMFSADLATSVAAFRQTIIDNRRALDYLATREDLDATRLGLLGASMGGIMGTVLTAVDQRVHSAFLVVGGGDLVGLFLASMHPAADDVRKALQGMAEQARPALAYIEPTNFAAHISPRPLQMLNGNDDQIMPKACAQALYDAARDPKRIVWYNGGAGEGHLPPLGVIATELKRYLNQAGFFVK